MHWNLLSLISLSDRPKLSAKQVCRTVSTRTTAMSHLVFLTRDVIKLAGVKCDLIILLELEYQVCHGHLILVDTSLWSLLQVLTATDQDWRARALRWARKVEETENTSVLQLKAATTWWWWGVTGWIQWVGLQLPTPPSPSTRPAATHQHTGLWSQPHQRKLLVNR